VIKEELREYLDQYLNLEIVPGKRVRVPYWLNKYGAGDLQRIQGPFGGKGTPNEIKKATLEKAKTLGVNPSEMPPSEIKKFMKENRIGVDCSGFVFHILNFIKPGFWKTLKMAPGRSPNPARRFNAAALSSPDNSIKVGKTKDVRVGDLIPVSAEGDGGIDHILIVVGVSHDHLVYAHSSSRTTIKGPHLGKMMITKPMGNLRDQQWQEVYNGGKLVDYLFDGNARRIIANNDL